MSYETEFNVDYYKLAHKGKVRGSHLTLNISSILGQKEPEPKVWLKSTNDFIRIRELFSAWADTAIIEGTLENDRNPLLSILLDERINGFPTMRLSKANRDLRLRGNISDQGQLQQLDWNEKSSMESSPIVNGLADRDEIEMEALDGMSLEDSYRMFQHQSEIERLGAVAEDVSFQHLHSKAGYITARSTYEFAIRLPLIEGRERYPVLMIFEACEDMTICLDGELTQTCPSTYYEFEAEAKRVIGELPPSIMRHPLALKNLVTKKLMMIRDAIKNEISGCIVNDNSKAGISLNQLQYLHAALNMHAGDLRDSFGNPVMGTEGLHFSTEEMAILLTPHVNDLIKSQTYSSRPPLRNAAWIGGQLARERADYNQRAGGILAFSINPYEARDCGIQLSANPRVTSFKPNRGNHRRNIA